VQRRRGSQNPVHTLLDLNLSRDGANLHGEIVPHAPDIGLAILRPPLLHRISLLQLIPKLIPEFFELPFDARGAEPCPTNE
jgi:hypothetical protein